MLSNFQEEVSYIRPRDPSIRNFNRMNLKRVNLQYIDETIQPPIEELDKCSEESYIPIYLRLKSNYNVEDYKTLQNQLIYRSVSESREAIYKQVTFSKIFDADDHQNKIFDEVVKLRVFEFLNGKNSTIFTYGAPGAGRSYTTVGTEKDPGFLPRSLEYIFKTLPKLPDAPIIKPTPEGRVIRLDPSQRKLEAVLKTSTLKSQRVVDRLENVSLYQSMQERLKNETYAFLEELSEVSIGICVSFLEICNEEIYDVLERNVPKKGERKKLRLGTFNGNPCVKDLTFLCVSNALEVFQIYQYGIQKLKTSKIISHSVFTIWMASTKSDCETTFLSSLNICNLASADELGRNGDKPQYKERNSVKNSLMVLGKCINTLEDSLKNPNIKNMIPYRESKLSLLCQRALSAMEDFCILININPSKQAHVQTLNVLNFSALKKNVIPKETFMKCKNENQKKSTQLVNMFELENELKMLQDTFLETQSSYEDLKRNFSKNIELEKQAFTELTKETFQDAEQIFNLKKKNLEENFKHTFTNELNRMKHNIQKKFKKVSKTRNKNKLKNLRSEYLENNATITNYRNEVTKLEKELQDLKYLSFQIQSREKVIAEYLATFGEKETDSFSLNDNSLGLPEDNNMVNKKTTHNNQMEKDDTEFNSSCITESTDESVEENVNMVNQNTALNNQIEKDDTAFNSLCMTESTDESVEENVNMVNRKTIHNNQIEKDDTEFNLSCMIESTDESVEENVNTVNQNTIHNNQVEKDDTEFNSSCMTESADESVVEYEANSNKNELKDLENVRERTSIVHINSKQKKSNSSSNSYKNLCLEKSIDDCGAVLENKTLDSFLMHEISFEIEEHIDADNERKYTQDDSTVSEKTVFDSINDGNKQRRAQSEPTDKTILLTEESLPELVITFEQTQMESTLLNNTN